MGQEAPRLRSLDYARDESGQASSCPTTNGWRGWVCPVYTPNNSIAVSRFTFSRSSGGAPMVSKSLS